MIIPDVNLLIYAHVPSSIDHAKSLIWWREILAGPEQIGLPDIVISSFLRLTTNTRLFGTPFTPAEAVDLANKWLTHQNIELLLGEEINLRKLLENVKARNLSGNSIPDMQIAIFALQHNAVLHSADTGFKRYEDLKWFNPITGEFSPNLYSR